MNRLNKKFVFFLFAFAIVIYLFIQITFPKYGADGSDNLYYTVKKDTLEIDLSLRGQIDAVKFTTVTTPDIMVDRIELTWLIEEGKEVQEGDTIAIFNDKNLKQELEDLELKFTNDEESFEKLKSDLDVKKRVASLNIKQHEESFQLSKKEFELSKYESKLQQNRKNLDLMKAEDALERAYLDSTNTIDDLKKQIIQKERQIQKLKEDIEQKKEYLSKMYVTAPTSGLIVLSKIWKSGRREPVREGDRTWPGQAIITIPDLSQIKNIIYVDEFDIGRIDKGLKAVVSPNAYPEQIYRGEITFISALANQQAMYRGETNYEVHVLLNEPDSLLKPGMSTNTVIKIEKIADILLVPIDSVIESEGKYYVYESDSKKVEVQIGKRNDRFVEITGGLEEGDEIILNAYDLAEPGS